MSTSLVHTIHGLVPRDKLEVKDVISEEGDARVTVTQWFLNGELVRNDVHVNILQGQDLVGTQAV